jgi:hypothetical protein
MSNEWIASLQEHVEKKPCLVVRFNNDEWERLLDTRNKANEFTVARAHHLFDNVKVPTLVVVFGAGAAYLGIASNLGSASTLETWVKVRRAFEISPSTQADVRGLVKEPHLHAILKGQFDSPDSVVRLSPKVSSAVVAALASIGKNAGGMKRLVDDMARPKRYTGTAAMEEDAVQTALKAFGIAPTDRPDEVQVTRDYDGAIRRISALEDAAIEHDARTIPGLKLVRSDITGRAVFRRGDEELEVFTANKRPLERVMGVDLVYLNLTRSNIAMLQYKMLTAHREGKETDWIYRPDEQLAEEIKRMETFSAQHKPGKLEYRLNAGAFFLKFVRKDGAIKQGGIFLPLDHYKLTLLDPACSLGERGGVRISYKSLAGRYMREDAFLELLRSGYIGPHAKTTEHFAALVRSLVENDHAVVGAIVQHQKAAAEAQGEAGTKIDFEELEDDLLS